MERLKTGSYACDTLDEDYLWKYIHVIFKTENEKSAQRMASVD